jgi:hypothetical protein
MVARVVGAHARSGENAVVVALADAAAAVLAVATAGLQHKRALGANLVCFGQCVRKGMHGREMWSGGAMCPTPGVPSYHLTPAHRTRKKKTTLADSCNGVHVHASTITQGERERERAMGPVARKEGIDKQPTHTPQRYRACFSSSCQAFARSPHTMPKHTRYESSPRAGRSRLADGESAGGSGCGKHTDPHNSQPPLSNTQPRQRWSVRAHARAPGRR